MPEKSADERYRIVIDEAARALTHQQGAIDSLRTRATTLVAATVLITSFLGPPALAMSHHVTWPSKVALGAMTVVILCTGAICAPVWKWRFRSSASALTTSIKRDIPLDDFRRKLATDFEGWHDRNERGYRALQWLFTVALCALLVELLCWMLQLKGVA